MNPELTATFVNAHRVNFYSASASLTDRSEFGTFTYLSYFGMDVHYFSGKTNRRQLQYVTSLGFHLGISPMIEITPNLAIRADFKYNLGPGQSLIVGTGLMVSF